MEINDSSVCSELEGESKDIVKERLQMFRDMYTQHFGKEYMRAGNSWLSISQNDRYIYLEGLIEGIRTATILGKQWDSDMKLIYEGLVNVDSEITKIADIVTSFYKIKANKIIDYRFLFPIAHMKFKGTDNSFIEDNLKQLRKTERSRRLQK